ncbi:E3 ubiquitin-protein ligase RHF2A [Striga hermonthica]|uniref:RING-type E3 ubiquitin transferase n=1 Tax=Striga hermonthica TaxID=68872 RepID=A0A9N7RE99_STRHE|nr:E3 ubiquitin-protein ligase RHF2A [Striga hermonthica]
MNSTSSGISNALELPGKSSEMEKGQVSESSLTSAAAFVEGGIQEACDDACSICLEAFCDSDPSTVTSCKHEFHLQCILEWCQRSSQCPMCWQSISLKDPSSQELLDAVEHERNMRMNPPRNTTIFHHPTLGDFELQHLPVNATESELEERIIQHLAAAAAMGRARQLARRVGPHRSSAQARPQFLVFSTNTNGNNPSSASARTQEREGSFGPPAVNSPLVISGEDASRPVGPPSPVQTVANEHGTSSGYRSPIRTSPGGQDRAGPSDLQSFSDNLKSRLSALSTRYKESITKSTRGWKERLFARNNSTPEIPLTTEIRQDSAGQGVATVSRMMDHLEIAEVARASNASVSINLEDSSSTNATGHQAIESSNLSLSEDTSSQVPSAAASSELQ